MAKIPDVIDAKLTYEDCNLRFSDIKALTIQKPKPKVHPENEWEYVKCYEIIILDLIYCLLYTSPSPRDQRGSRMPSSA